MDRVRVSGAVAPVAAAERLEALDVLRGFALLGILLMNIEAFVAPLMDALTGIDPSLSGADLWADAAIFILVQGKFYALFSLLFGMGFAIMLDRAARSGSAGTVLYLRRLLVLLGIGAVHALLVWSGDILLVYATMGLVMLAFFRSTPAARLRWWGLGIFLVPIVITWLFALSVEAARHDPEAAEAVSRSLAAQSQQFQALGELQREAYGPGGSYMASVEANVATVAMMFAGYLPIFGPTILGLFLIGAWFIRSGAIADADANPGLFRNLAMLGGFIGLPLVVLGAWLMPTMDPGRMDLVVAAATTANLLGSLLMALGYLAGVVLLLQVGRWAPRLAMLAPAGRMALTNYLIQSVVCTLVFYGYGLGFYEQLPRAWQVPFVLALFCAQVVLSHWWLARFRFGPAEWMWRSLTYLRLQPMRLDRVAGHTAP